MKNIIASLFSGLFGVLLTIGYQHYFTQPRPYTVIYNGEKVNVVEIMESYNALKNDFNDLSDEYNQVKTLYENESYTYTLLQEENDQLKNEIAQSQNEINDLQNEIKKMIESNSDNTQSTATNSDNDNSATNKVSIFTMSTFQGIGGWYDRSHVTLNNSNFIDTYDNEYLSACVGGHGIRTINSNNLPTYLLNGSYSKCQGQFAWPKSKKNYEGSIWVEFYSDDILLYQTDAITATDKAISFEFSVEGVEKMTIIRNGTVKNLSAIYPYLDLIQ